MGEAVRELTPLVGEIDGPLAVFGHSMGGLIAFELTRALEGCGRPIDHLFLSCCAPRGDQRFRAGVDDDVLYARLGIDAGAIPASLRSLTSTTLRADLELCETFRPDGAVRAPVTVVVATADPLVPPGHAARWRAHAAGPIGFVPVTGGHDLLASVPHELLEIVTGALAPEGRP
jgi:surfactin synthase thioesterase subunit